MIFPDSEYLGFLWTDIDKRQFSLEFNQEMEKNYLDKKGGSWKVAVSKKFESLRLSWEGHWLLFARGIQKWQILSHNLPFSFTPRLFEIYSSYTNHMGRTRLPSVLYGQQISHTVDFFPLRPLWYIQILLRELQNFLPFVGTINVVVIVKRVLLPTHRFTHTILFHKMSLRHYFIDAIGSAIWFFAFAKCHCFSLNKIIFFWNMY